MKNIDFLIHSSLYRGAWMKEVGTNCNFILKVPVCPSCHRIWLLRQFCAYLAVLLGLVAAFYLAVYDILDFPLGFILACLLTVAPIWLVRLKRQHILSWLRLYEPMAWKIVKTTS